MDKQDWRMSTAMRILYIAVLGTTLSLVDIASGRGVVVAAVTIVSAVILFTVVQWLNN